MKSDRRVSSWPCAPVYLAREETAVRAGGQEWPGLRPLPSGFGSLLFKFHNGTEVGRGRGCHLRPGSPPCQMYNAAAAAGLLWQMGKRGALSSALIRPSQSSWAFEMSLCNQLEVTGVNPFLITLLKDSLVWSVVLKADLWVPVKIPRWRQYRFK